jgi:hypothetical protein
VIRLLCCENIFCYEDISASTNSAIFYAYENSKQGIEERKGKTKRKKNGGRKRGRMKGREQTKVREFLGFQFGS